LLPPGSKSTAYGVLDANKSDDSAVG
jgi:hypothetical protein